MHYFREYRFEKGGQFYKKLGIHHFKKLVPFGDFFFKIIRLVKPRFSLVTIKAHIIKEARSMVFFTIFVEIIHLLFFVIMIFIFFRKYHLTGEINYKVIFMNLVFNVLPIMVQRYNRIRITRIFNLRGMTS